MSSALLILWRSLSQDKRFEQVPIDEATPGDIVIPSHPSQADGYVGVVVDDGRVVSNSSKGVQDESSVAEIQRHPSEMTAFRYVGVWSRHNKPLANAGFNPSEARIPKEQLGGGQWTDGLTKLLLSKKDGGVDSLTESLFRKEIGAGLFAAILADNAVSLRVGRRLRQRSR